ncbi:TPA: phage tail protein [Streptococcus suis]|nr:phage tail protein [Streptococcus suis]HEM2818614.1 phage tail protein [Streptococcus suis]
MIRHNALTIGGVSTGSFPFKVIVEDSPSITVSESKTILIEHQGLSGAVLQSNPHRSVMDLSYTLYLVKPSEEQLYSFLKLFLKEEFWLENSSFKTTRWWCYKASHTPVQKDKLGVYETKVTFSCHPTKWFKTTTSQVFRTSGTLRSQGSAIAFPKITISGNSSSETSFTIGDDVIRLERLQETLIMDNNPSQPSFKTQRGQPVKWSGDFISIDAGRNDSVGVVLGAGITSLTIEMNWGWA